MKIESERLIITLFDESMAQAVHENSLDDDTRRFLPDEVFETADDARETIEYLMSRYDSQGGPFVYPVLLRDGANIGYVQLVAVEDGFEVGYHIAKKHTQNGYATEALGAFLGWLKTHKDLECVYGICDRENVGSMRVLEKCGFEKEYEGDGEYQGKVTKIAKYSLAL